MKRDIPAKPGPTGMIINGESDSPELVEDRIPVCRQAGIWLKNNKK